MLGAADNDTDEYDQHVVAHEFQHFLEDQVSRSDTPGGPHSLDERLDMRVAFSEGFANAFSAMVLNDPVYRDSFGASQGQVYRFDVEQRAGRLARLVQRDVGAGDRVGPVRCGERRRRRRSATGRCTACCAIRCATGRRSPASSRSSRR